MKPYFLEIFIALLVVAFSLIGIKWTSSPKFMPSKIILTFGGVFFLLYSLHYWANTGEDPLKSAFCYFFNEKPSCKDEIAKKIEKEKISFNLIEQEAAAKEREALVEERKLQALKEVNAEQERNAKTLSEEKELLAHKEMEREEYLVKIQKKKQEEAEKIRRIEEEQRQEAEIRSTREFESRRRAFEITQQRIQNSTRRINLEGSSAYTVPVGYWVIEYGSGIYFEVNGQRVEHPSIDMFHRYDGRILAVPQNPIYLFRDPSSNWIIIQQYPTD